MTGDAYWNMQECGLRHYIICTFGLISTTEYSINCYSLQFSEGGENTQQPKYLVILQLVLRNKKTSVLPRHRGEVSPSSHTHTAFPHPKVTDSRGQSLPASKINVEMYS